MNSDFEPEDPLGGMLRGAMHDEAEWVQPAGDGLARIQQRVQARRDRMRWVRPLAALGTAAVVIAAGIGAYVTLGTDDGKQSITVTTQTPTPVVTTPTATVTSTTPPPTTPPAPTFPQQAIFPFTSQTAEQAWEQQYDAQGSQPWVADPAQTALSFVHGWLALPSIDQQLSKTLTTTTAAVLLGRWTTDAGNTRPTPVVSVRLVKFGKAWLVVGADDPQGYLKLSTPKATASISSPVTVTGPGFGVDENIRIDVRSTDTATPLGSGQVGFGNGTPTWSVDVPFTTSTSTSGALVAIEANKADSGPQRVVVRPIRFATTGAAPAYPAYFVGIKDQRVAVFSSRDGAALRYLTDAQPGGGASDPQLEGGTVYYLQGSGTCSNALWKVPFDGGTPAQVTAPGQGYVVSGYAVSSDGTKVAVFEEACGSSSPQGRLVSTDSTTGATHTIAFQAAPPRVIGDPSWEPDGRHLDAWIITGMMGDIERFDAFHDTTDQNGTSVCRPDGQSVPQNGPLEVDGNGTVWFTTQVQSDVKLYRCSNSAATLVSDLGNVGGQDLDVTSDGMALLLTNPSGEVWKWNFVGQPEKLSPPVPLSNVSW